MGLRGPKKKTAAELAKTPGNAHRVKVRRREEAAKQAALTVLPSIEVPNIPQDLVDPDAVAQFERIYRGYAVPEVLRIVVLHACYALQRANSIRRVIDTGDIMKMPRHLLQAETAARAQFTQMCDKLKLFEQE